MTNANGQIEPIGRSPDWDLALAFFGSIFVGMLSPTIPLLASGWLFGFSSGWLGAVWGLLAMFGSMAGMVWGILNVIVSAAATLEKRKTTTLWMFAVLWVALMAVDLLLMRGVADVSGNSASSYLAGLSESGGFTLPADSGH